MEKSKVILAWILLLCFCMTGAASAEDVVQQNPEEINSEDVVQTGAQALTELSVGAKGDAVFQMQKRLAVLGFFFTAQDGIYGANTQNAVKAFEEYLRLLESDEIERRLEAEKTHETDEKEATAEVSATPEPTPLPTPAPTPIMVADGIADKEVLETLFSDADALYRRDAQLSDQGLDVTRIQRRLVALNYLNDEPDGRFGVNTETALKAFQREHEMNETGIADLNVQRILFSEGAIISEKPVYNQLYLGMTGENVKAVQQQLRLLGFMNAKASGTFDAKTEEAVKQLEIYLHQLDLAERNVKAETINALEESRRSTEKTIVPKMGIRSDDLNVSGGKTALIGEPLQQSDAAGEQIASEAKPDAAVFAAAPVNPAQMSAKSPSSVADGFVPRGVVTAEMQSRLLEEGIPVYLQTVKKGDVSVTSGRVQRRLYALGYLTANGVDGMFGAGTEKAVIDFQRRNRLQQTGVADQAMQAALFSEEAVKAIKPYLIKVSNDDQRVYVYTHDDNDEYNILVKEFICSTGLRDTPTPAGTFTNTGPGARWHYFKKWECWAQYAYYIDGDIMFHSVLYSDDDERTLNKGSVNNLGRRASHGCVRLKVEDAKWIWDNCAAGTKVIVF